MIRSRVVAPPTPAGRPRWPARWAVRWFARLTSRGAPSRTASGRVVAALACAFVPAMVLALAGCGSGQAAGDPTFLGTVTTWGEAERGDPIALVGTTFTGEAVDLSDWRGSVVVLNLWYASCPPCRQEASELAQVANDHPEVRFLGINATDDAATVAAFERTFATPFPSLDDSDGAARAALAGVASLQAYPTTLVLDAQGRVAGRVLGALDATTLEGLIADASSGSSSGMSTGEAGG